MELKPCPFYGGDETKKYDWIEKALGKKLLWQPVRIGLRFGRELYTIVFEDHSEGDYFIDYDKMEIEKY